MKKLFLFTLAFLFAATLQVTGQTPAFPDVATLTPETLFDATVDPLYGLCVLLFGYLSGFIPGLKNWKPFLRVLAFGLSVALGLTLFGGASIWKLALTYFLTSGLYSTFFKQIFASPKPAAA